MDQFVHHKNWIRKRKQKENYYDYTKTIYVNAVPDVLNFANQQRVIVEVGVASRSYLDNYNKKIGRALAKEKARKVLYRLDTLQLVPHNEELDSSEHFLITLVLNTDQEGPPKSLLFKTIPGNSNVFLLDATF